MKYFLNTCCRCSQWGFYVFCKVVTRAEGRVHTLILRDVKLTDAGEVSLTAKDFRTQANLFVKGKSVILVKL